MTIIGCAFLFVDLGMERNNLLNQRVKSIGEMFCQRQCDKHEYIMVTKTTSTTKEGKTEINKSNSWMQCKKCGRLLDVSAQLNS